MRNTPCALQEAMSGKKSAPLVWSQVNFVIVLRPSHPGWKTISPAFERSAKPSKVTGQIDGEESGGHSLFTHVKIGQAAPNAKAFEQVWQETNIGRSSTEVF